MILTPINETCLPRIAIVGRPNVGKSTLFNRLLHSRRAITDATPGVTRDAIESLMKIGDKSYMLVDTGGYNLEKEDFNMLVAKKAIESAKTADLILLMIDVNTLDSNDFTFIEQIRTQADKIFLVVNKVDDKHKELIAYEHHGLGFKEVITISAAHNLNIDILEEKITAYFKDFQFVQKPPAGEEKPIRIAIMGKPNTGKSTLANLLLGEEKSIVSDIPGTTRDVVEGSFIFNKKVFQLMDTAGIRRKTKVTDSIEYYSVNRAIATIERADIILLLIDSVDGVTDQDKKIASLAVDKGRGIILVLSKWDLLEDITNRLESMVDRTHFLFPVLSFAPVLPLSAQKKQGVQKILRSCISIADQLSNRVETSRLNILLKQWIENYTLRDKGKVCKIFYATQVGVNPVRFVLFVNNLAGFRQEYITYLKNKIKNDLGFKSIPFFLDLKERSH